MKILVADDSAFLREALRRLLEEEGFEVVEAEDGVEAITKIFEHAPDLILLDVTMPRLTGYVACRLIKEDPLVAAIPVLILTARDSVEDRYWAERSGADGFLTKDSLGDGLVTSTNAALAAHALQQLNRADVALPPTIGEVDVLSRVCDLLDKKLFEATMITELLSLANLAAEDRLLATTFGHLRRLVAFDAGAVVVPGTRHLYFGSPVDLAEEDLAEINDFSLRQLNSISGANRQDRLEVVRIAPPTDVDDGERGWGSRCATVIRTRGEVRGVLVLAARKHGVFDERATQTLRTLDPVLAGVAGSAIERLNRAEIAPEPVHKSLRLTRL